MSDIYLLLVTRDFLVESVCHQHLILLCRIDVDDIVMLTTLSPYISPSTSVTNFDVNAIENSLKALAMIDFVSFIGMIWFNGYTEIFPKPSCVYILYCAEVLIIVQAVLAIGGAALALVNSYIIISNFVDRFSDNTSPSRQLHRENNAEDNAQT